MKRPPASVIISLDAVFAATSRLIALDGCSFSDLPIEHMCDESIYTHKLGLDSLIQHIIITAMQMYSKVKASG